MNKIREQYAVPLQAIELIQRIEQEIMPQFAHINLTREYNQYKILHAFQKNQISSRHFLPSNGYGYDDAGRDALDQVYADVFRCQDALVRPQLVSGTHALSTCLYALLRPGDRLLSITGKPYDTLEDVIGITGQKGQGSLIDFHIQYEQVNLKKSGTLDMEQIEKELASGAKVIYMQRSRGYDWRPSLTIEEICTAVRRIRELQPNAVIMMDNCYGEFTDIYEPTEVGVDLIAGSLIKNPGGGLAPTGGYIAGRSDLIDLVSYRLTSPGIGREVGSYEGWYTSFYQGLFLAPHIVSESLKGAILAAAVFEKLGFQVLPESREKRSDIIQSIQFEDPDMLIAFCQGIQKAAPVDSYVVPEPWTMPGYQDPVIMAAGAFIQGASIELSADAPMRPPYIAYLQGGLTYDHCKIGIMIVLSEMMKKGLITL